MIISKTGRAGLVLQIAETSKRRCSVTHLRDGIVAISINLSENASESEKRAFVSKPSKSAFIRVL
ncbi:hypothetical protein IFT84_15015 [Rhizobium sp. CFBP 8762]|uniref:hypothetical protein n=1 Tax=Rhizobium sp. CFBP 8762 TaxID=2775279 RepID=UPI00177ED5E0|nr:hypothetical protein [Rhizobium sp. CFBP 8762]MBD8555817.1 hypothetical protein [Rhizobium sp. CFBP 8762]